MGSICGEPKQIPIAKIIPNAGQIINKYNNAIQRISIKETGGKPININHERFGIPLEVRYKYLKEILDNKAYDLYFMDILSTKIDLCGQHITELFDRIRLLKNVEKMLLCCNFLIDLPPTIGYMENLSVLNLSHNEIVRLPDEIGNLYSLKELNVGYNKLKTLPHTITSLKNLEILNIENNYFEELPAFIGRMFKLRRFNFSSNNIKTVPVEIMKLDSLYEVFSNRCPLELGKNVELPLLSLEELCARKIINSKLPIRRDISQFHINMFKSAKDCSFCLGATFTVGKFHMLYNFMNLKVPVVYTLCANHFKNRTDMTKKLFTQAPSINPGDGFSRPNSIYDSLNKYAISKKEKIKIEKTRDKMLVPLSALSLKNKLDTLNLDEKIKRL